MAGVRKGVSREIARIYTEQNFEKHRARSDISLVKYMQVSRSNERLRREIIRR